MARHPKVLYYHEMFVSKGELYEIFPTPVKLVWDSITQAYKTKKEGYHDWWVGPYDHIMGIEWDPSMESITVCTTNMKEAQRLVAETKKLISEHLLKVKNLYLDINKTFNNMVASIPGIKTI